MFHQLLKKRKRKKRRHSLGCERTGNESSFVVVDVLWRGGRGRGAAFFTARYGLRLCEPRLVLCGKALLSHG